MDVMVLLSMDFLFAQGSLEKVFKISWKNSLVMERSFSNMNTLFNKGNKIAVHSFWVLFTENSMPLLIVKYLQLILSVLDSFILA